MATGSTLRTGRWSCAVPSPHVTELSPNHFALGPSKRSQGMEAPSPRRSLDVVAACLLALAAAALLYGVVRTWPRTVDDAFITFRYAENLAEGAGPVFNPGERVEG